MGAAHIAWLAHAGRAGGVPGAPGIIIGIVVGMPVCGPGIGVPVGPIDPMDPIDPGPGDGSASDVPFVWGAAGAPVVHPNPKRPATKMNFLIDAVLRSVAGQSPSGEKSSASRGHLAARNAALP
jgi:hypothetical protein